MLPGSNDTPETLLDSTGLGQSHEDEPQQLDETSIQSYVSATIADCKKYVDTELSFDRTKASKYYRGAPFGNEETGRSQLVLTEVRDGILAVLPSMLRIFFGAESVVEFVPNGPKQVDMAQTATRYVQYVFTEDNPGFMMTHAVLKDGLIKRIGGFKWAWEKAPKRTYQLFAVSDEELQMLELDETLQVDEQVEADDPPDANTSKMLGEPPQPPQKYWDVVISRVGVERPRLYALPPEEILYSREARDPDTALFVGHRTEKTRGELMDLGISAEQLEEHDARDLSLRLNPEAIDRQMVQSTSGIVDPPAGDANDKLAFVDGYMLLDVDGDGINELRHLWTIGNTDFIVMDEPANARPFAFFCPDPEPHTMTGQSWADRTMDIQLLKSSLWRSMLDSLSASIYPRMAYQEAAVSTQDMLNTEIGAPIRVKKGFDVNTAVQSFVHAFAGKEAMPLLQGVDDIIRRRTGRDDGTAGIDASSLQSSTQEGVTAALSFSQEQIELVARVFAEMTLKPLFKGLLALLVEHQCAPRVVKIRGEWTTIDPAVWDDTMNVTVNVALGTAFVDRKIQTLMATAAEQKDILTNFPANPSVTLGMYIDTLHKILALQGFKDGESFFKSVDPNWQPPPPQPPQSPEMVTAQANIQIEQIRSQREMAIKQQELALKTQQMQLENERLIVQNAAQNELQRYELELKYHAKVSGDQLNADAEQQVSAVEQAVGVHGAIHAAAQGTHDQELAAQSQEHDQALSQAAAAAPPAGAGGGDVTGAPNGWSPQRGIDP